MTSEAGKENFIQEEAWLLREKYAGVYSPEFEIDRERLRRGEPLAYIIGWVPFLDTKIFLDDYPLIPRSETEYWVGAVIEELKKHTNAEGVRVLDLCAGSGCIGVAVANAIPEALVDFVEIDTTLYPNILKNIRINEIEMSRTRIFNGDLFEKVPKNTTYDLILSNPPYIDPALNRTDTSVKDFEPHGALYGGRLGVEIIEQIITEAHLYLSPSGKLYIEHEPEQAGMVAELATRNQLTSATLPDQYGVERYSILTKKASADMA